MGIAAKRPILRMIPEFRRLSLIDLSKWFWQFNNAFFLGLPSYDISF
jgi:hypothetical protein